MNAAHARSTTADVVNGLTDEPIPDHAEQVLLDDDGVVHLANAYRQISHADASGVALHAVSASYDEVETVLRHRCVDVLSEHVDDAPDQGRHEDLIAILEDGGSA